MRFLTGHRLHLRITPSWLVPILLSAVLMVVVAGAAVTAIETHTVSSFGTGLWWATGLITTVGFIGEPPETTAGIVLSALLMIVGFLLLATVSASLAALFVREEERPIQAEESATDQRILETLDRLEQRLSAIEAKMDPHRE